MKVNMITCKAKYFNDSLKSAKFLSWHLLLHFSNARTSKNKYRPVSVLPVIFKTFEHIIGKQLSAFFEDIFSKFQCGFHKGYNTRLYPLMMLGSWKEFVNESKALDALMMDLSKAFDCLNHHLIIAKVHA